MGFRLIIGFIWQLQLVTTITLPLSAIHTLKIRYSTYLDFLDTISLVTISNGRHFPSSGLPNCPIASSTAIFNQLYNDCFFNRRLTPDRNFLCHSRRRCLHNWTKQKSKPDCSQLNQWIFSTYNLSANTSRKHISLFFRDSEKAEQATLFVLCSA
jgi:hypothetical protein